jgi:hypothetical protein
MKIGTNELACLKLEFGCDPVSKMGPWGCHMLNTVLFLHKSHFVHRETVELHGPESFLRSW